MSNFLKFLKLILENFINRNNLRFIYEIKKTNFEIKFSNIKKCKDFFEKYKIRDYLKLLGKEKKINSHLINNFKTFLDLKIIDIYSNFFLSSDFLISYLFPKLMMNHDNSYYLIFCQYLQKIS